MSRGDPEFFGGPAFVSTMTLDRPANSVICQLGSRRLSRGIARIEVEVLRLNHGLIWHQRERPRQYASEFAQVAGPLMFYQAPASTGGEYGS